MTKNIQNLCFILLCCPMFLFGESGGISAKNKNLILQTVKESMDPNFSGYKILHKEVQDLSEMQDKKRTYYNLSLENVPLTPNQKFTFYIVNTLGNIAEMYNVYVKNDSKAYFKADESHEFAFENQRHSIFQPMPGESFDYVLLSTDGKVRASAHIVPRPIKCVSPSGKMIQLEIKSKDGSAFVLSGKNFKPNEEITLASNLNNENFSRKINLNKDGEFTVKIDPRVRLKKNGTSCITIYNSEEPPLNLRFVWGNDFLKKSLDCEISDFFKSSEVIAS